MHRALLAQVIRRAGAILAEVKVKADDGTGNTEPSDQDLADEVLGAGRCKGGIEGHHNRAVESGGRQQPQLVAVIAEPKQRHLGPEELAGVRREGQRRRGLPQACRAPAGQLDHGAVAAMHAVKIADRHDRAREAGRRLVMSNCERMGKRARHHRRAALREPADLPHKRQAVVSKLLTYVRRLTRCSGAIGHRAAVGEAECAMAVDLSMPILVVDDYATMIRIIRNLLRQLGFENVDEASDGRAALAKLRARKFGLVISDWNMAPMTGYELLLAVRGDKSLYETPFIMITAESKTDNVIAAKKAGVNNYIVKPFNAATLKGKIDAVFEDVSVADKTAAIAKNTLLPA